jgi:hypothetical protein
VTDDEVLAGLLRRSVTEHAPCWFEPDLLYIDHAIQVTPEERDALLRAGVEPPLPEDEL